MREISADDFCEILEDHEKWLYSDNGAEGRTDLRGANLRHADLGGAKLSATILIGVDLRATYNLRFANLICATLHDADLSGVDLRGANLSDAMMIGVDLSNANLCKANFEEANLEGTRNLTIEQLPKVETLYNIKLDPELMEQVVEKYPHLLEKPEKEESNSDE